MSDYKRARAHDLHAEGKSIREIAEILGVGKSTVDRWLKQPRPKVDGSSAPPPPPDGNERATKHGAHSERRVGPLRERFVREVRDRWPHLGEDDPRVATLADRMARVTLVSTWMDGQEDIVTPGGDVFNAMREMEKWASRLEALTVELNQEAGHGAGAPKSGDHLHDFGRLTVEQLRTLNMLLAIARGEEPPDSEASEATRRYRAQSAYRALVGPLGAGELPPGSEDESIDWGSGADDDA